MRLEDLAAQNPWWKFGKDFKEYDRDLSKIDFIEFKRKKLDLKAGIVYLIRGPRQTGKSTYLKQTIIDLLMEGVNKEVIVYISCDRLSSRNELSNILNNFVNENMGAARLYAFIDEITYLKEWDIFIKTLSDSNQMNRLVVVATGSSPLKLKEGLERWPGRIVKEFYFKPLTFREFILGSLDRIWPGMDSRQFSESLRLLRDILAKTKISKFDDLKNAVGKIKGFISELDYLFKIYMHTGGYPKPINSYFKNFLEKKEIGIEPEIYEIPIKMLLSDMSKIERNEIIARNILHNIFERYGTKKSFTGMGNDLQIHHKTVIEYLDLFESSMVIYVLNLVDISKMKEREKSSKKIYFSDPFIYHGLAAYLRGEDGFKFSKENMPKIQSGLIEGMAASHLIQSKERPYLKEWKTFLWFYHTHTGKEIDFIYKGNRELWGIEIKYQESANSKDILKIQGVNEYLLLTKNNFNITKEITILPVSLFLCLLEKSDFVL